jgi:hypothetical protein
MWLSTAASPVMLCWDYQHSLAPDAANILEKHSAVEKVLARVVGRLVREATNLRERVLAALPKGRLGRCTIGSACFTRFRLTVPLGCGISS